jgi:hypothetical protein
MVYIYKVEIDINEDDWNWLHGHQPFTAGKLFREEIQSDLESCPEPNEVRVTLEKVERTWKRQEAEADYDIVDDPRN